MSAEIRYKPKMVGIVCNWCCYGGADLAGVSRFQYPPYIKLIRVMCSGRVDMGHIFRAFLNGADGVFIGGCHLNDCHYITNGNYDAYSMVQICKKILNFIGVTPERLRVEWVSAGEGIRFANIMNEFSAEIEKLGPLGKREGIDENTLKFKLESAMRLIPYIKLIERERLRVPARISEEEFYKFFTTDEFNRLFNETIVEKLIISQIISLLRKGPLTTGEIAKVLGLTPSEVSRHLSSSSRHRFVRYDGSLKSYALA